jgi:DnaJ-class molecular chaperone
MAKTKDYYDVLGVPRTATQKEITAAFRKLARKHHPDLNAGDKQAEAKFKEISEAHDVLSEAKSRKLYDEFGADWRSAQQAGVEPGTGRRSAGGGFRPQQQGGPGVQYRTVTPEDMEDMFGDSGSFGDIFGSIFGNSSRTRSRPAPIDVEAPITVSLGEVYRGTSRTGASRSTSRPASRKARSFACLACERRCRSRTILSSRARAKTCAYPCPSR